MKIETEHYTLYHGNALDLLPEIMADCIVTDPPYKLISGGSTNSVGKMSGCFAKENYNNNGSIVDCPNEWPEFMKPMFDSLRSPGHAYFMANDKNQFEMQMEALKAGFRFHNLLTWDKGTVTPNRWYMKGCEYVGFFFKGKAFSINDCSSKQLIYIPQKDVTDHPTEKPVDLMRYYILNSTKAGQTVLDPFMGSGSTGVAAILSGRKFIGIDLKEKWVNVTHKRLEEAIKRLPHVMPDLFN